MSHTPTKLHTISALIAVVALACHVSPPAFAQKPRTQSVAEPEEDNSVEAELASFELAPGYEVNLFADENDGIANPVCMSWDPAGRLWVLVRSAYPQLEQAASPDDQLLILEDSDQDGHADKTTVFARGLNMPTGFALGHGGAYVGMGIDLIHLSDTDGDDRADRKRLVFTGFGTGDTHQNINSFTWSPGGEMLFCQGVSSFSRIETPWGISRLDQHGSWRMRPLRRQLHGYQRTGAGGNPWGILFGNWGEAFIKSNGPPIAELIPSMVSSDLPGIRQGFEMVIGRTQPKSMIMEIPESPHLPDDIQGDLLTAGYFGHVIHRMKVERDRAGHRLKNQPPLLRATHRAFRPVDLRVGPDGALYVADWFNPIIGHYQASLRHPDRDKTHGRIWRISATGRPLAAAPDFSRMDVAKLCDQLKSNWRYTRYQAKRRLADLPADKVIPAIRKWVDGLGSGDTNLERHLYEAIGIYESHEVVNRPLLERLLESREAGARAYAARVVGRWSDRIEAPLELLDRRVNDEDSRVRMEAIVACSEIRSAESLVVAAKVLDHPRDRFTDYALASTAKALASRWLPALQEGTITFADPEHLVFVLEAHGGKNVAGQVRSLAQSEAISKEARRQLLQLLARVGDSNDLLTVFQHSRQDPSLLQSLPVIASHRRLVPSGCVHNELAALLKSEDPATRAAAARLSGLWNKRELTAQLEPMIGANENALVRAAAIRSLAELAPAAASKRFTPLIDVTHGSPVYLAALESVARHDMKTAAVAGLKLLADLDSAESFGPVLSVIMNRRGGAEAMAVALGPASISADDAKLISRWLSAAGHDDAALVGALKSRMGIKPGRETPYDISLVRSLAKEIRESGNAAAGKRVFTSSLANCTACHRVQNVTTKVDAFPKGPDLSAVAAGLQLELIVESVIWPKRAIKEGFEMTTILTDDGRAFSGYVTSEDDSMVGLRDLGTGQVRRIPVETIEDRLGKGTAMPSGFTNSLTREELRDLIAWLATLKGEPAK